jgi:hypothetical protein
LQALEFSEVLCLWGRQEPPMGCRVDM